MSSLSVHSFIMPDLTESCSLIILVGHIFHTCRESFSSEENDSTPFSFLTSLFSHWLCQQGFPRSWSSRTHFGLEIWARYRALLMTSSKNHFIGQELSPICIYVPATYITGIIWKASSRQVLSEKGLACSMHPTGRIEKGKYFALYSRIYV